MEYRLALTMDSQNDFLGVYPYINLIDNPSCDYVNPGIGQISRLYDLYIPIHTESPFTIAKIDNNEEQAGNGLSEDSENKRESIEQSDNSDVVKSNESNVSKIVEAKNENLKRKLDMGIFDSFQHPKIKVGKITLPSKPNKNQSQKAKSHKFAII